MKKKEKYTTTTAMTTTMTTATSNQERTTDIRSIPPSSSSARLLDRNTILWWATLSLISLVNICVWVYSYRTLIPSGSVTSNDDDRPHHVYQRYLLFLAGIYVFVCAYRSFLPRIDLERYCLWDTPLSSIFLGRLSATIAEVCFACQIALFLRRLGTVHEHPYSVLLSLLLVPAISIAQIFCWCGVVTLNHGYHAMEESIWAICALFVGLELGSLVIFHPDKSSLFVLGTCGSLGCFAFVYFMVTVDVPMYVRRWNGGDEIGREGTD